MFKPCIFILMILASLSVDASCKSCQKPSQSPYIKERLNRQDKRYRTFNYALELMEERRAKTLVETGTSRHGSSNCSGDGCSTLIFAQYVKQNGGSFYSVDIDPKAIQNAKNGLGADHQYVHLITSDSISFLENFGQPIDFLYLDSLDYDSQNPLPAQEHHLKEIQAAYPFLSRNAIIMIDDHSLPNGGKGKLVIEYLAKRGWKIVAIGYQVVLIQE